MSTKIYNAYKFNGKMVELMSHIKKYKDAWFNYCLNNIAIPYEEEKLTFDQLRKKIEEQSISRLSSYSDQYDTRGSVVVYFHKKDIYIQTFLHGPVLGDDKPNFLNDKFEDFHYQNQCDPWYVDEGLVGADKRKAARNWKKREKVWDEIYENSSIPSECGLVYEMMDVGDFYELAFQLVQKKKQKDEKTA